MFATDMGSLAYQNIYDLMEIDKSLMFQSDTKIKDMPSGVSKLHPHLMDKLMDARETVNDVITQWLVAVIIQERGTKDIENIDNKMNNILTKRGIIDDAKECAQPFVKNVEL